MVCVDGKPRWSKLYLNFPCFRNSHQVQANCNCSICSRVGYQVLILAAQRCPRFSQRYGFEILGKYKTTAHAWAKHFSMKNEAVSKIEVLYLNTLPSDREILVGWSDFPISIQEEEQVRKNNLRQEMTKKVNASCRSEGFTFQSSFHICFASFASADEKVNKWAKLGSLYWKEICALHVDVSKNVHAKKWRLVAFLRSWIGCIHY